MHQLPYFTFLQAVKNDTNPITAQERVANTIHHLQNHFNFFISLLGLYKCEWFLLRGIQSHSEQAIILLHLFCVCSCGYQLPVVITSTIALVALLINSRASKSMNEAYQENLFMDLCTRSLHWWYYTIKLGLNWSSCMPVPLEPHLMPIIECPTLPCSAVLVW